MVSDGERAGHPADKVEGTRRQHGATVDLRFTPSITSTPEQRIHVEDVLERFGVALGDWRAHPHEDPAKGPWAPPSLELLVDGHGALALAQTADLLPRHVVPALAEIRRTMPELGFSIHVAVDDGLVFLSYRIADGPDAVLQSADAISQTLFATSAAFGWDAGDQLWRRL
jgi:hypothetical protein